MARGSSRIGSRVTGKAKYMYGDPEEIANRDKGAYQNPETSFRQIPPGDRGGSLNEPNLTVKSGNLKYSPRTP